MTDDQPSSQAGQPQGSGSSSFLGGGPKFNQAGLNAPLPGENVAEVTPPSRFSSRLLIGVALAVVLIAALLVIYAHQPGGHGGRAGVNMNKDRPSDNPDEPSAGQ